MICQLWPHLRVKKWRELHCRGGGEGMQYWSQSELFRLKCLFQDVAYIKSNIANEY